MVRSVALLACASILSAYGNWSQHYNLGTPLENSDTVPTVSEHANALRDLDLEAVASDIKQLLTQDNPQWPIDSPNGGPNDPSGGNYGPLFVRLAWHCSGTYRNSDGKGGCGGGGQRFEPLRSWDDNVNLDKARALLAPIKAKYGSGLSWGDLIIATGTIAMREMGTPLPQFCLGRDDESDGTSNLALGINGMPETADPPCEIQGICKDPVGSGTIGLIYVNPEGPVVEAGGSPVPDPALSAIDIRDVFSRMGQDDRATVALIGGGHAFGKCHGACPDGQGLSPSEAYAKNDSMAWQGTCGEGDLKGKGPNTFTSGFEGPWTTTPTTWGNEFFTSLLDREWEKITGPADHFQWRVKNAKTYEDKMIMRLTSDLALLHDERYLKIVKEFAADQSALDSAFAHAWFKLTHSGGTWSPNSRCDSGEMPAWIMDQNNKMLDSDTVLV